SQYKTLLPSDFKGMELGIGSPSTRTLWFWAEACFIFQNSEPYDAERIKSYWTPAFGGLKAMLGYRSRSFDHAFQDRTAEEFWVNWANGSATLSDAFFHAEAEGYYDMSS